MEAAVSLRGGLAENLAGSLTRHGIVPNWYYNSVPEYFYRQELGEFRTHRIQVVTQEDTDTLHDVSVCHKITGQIVELLNHNQVSPVHLRDIVMDMLP